MKNAIHKSDPASDDTLYILTAAASNSHYFLDELYGVLENVGYQGAFNMEILPPKQMNRKTAVDYYTMAHGIATGLISKDTDRWMDD